jgi:hypothetical protein
VNHWRRKYCKNVNFSDHQKEEERGEIYVNETDLWEVDWVKGGQLWEGKSYMQMEVSGRQIG